MDRTNNSNENKASDMLPFSTVKVTVSKEAEQVLNTRMWSIMNEAKQSLHLTFIINDDSMVAEGNWEGITALYRLIQSELDMILSDRDQSVTSPSHRVTSDTGRQLPRVSAGLNRETLPSRHTPSNRSKSRDEDSDDWSLFEADQTPIRKSNQNNVNTNSGKDPSSHSAITRLLQNDISQVDPPIIRLTPDNRIFQEEKNYDAGYDPFLQGLKSQSSLTSENHIDGRQFNDVGSMDDSISSLDLLQSFDKESNDVQLSHSKYTNETAADDVMKTQQNDQKISQMSRKSDRDSPNVVDETKKNCTINTSRNHIDLYMKDSITSMPSLEPLAGSGRRYDDGEALNSPITSMPPLEPVEDIGKSYDIGENTTSSITNMPPLEPLVHTGKRYDDGENATSSITSMPPLEPVEDIGKSYHDRENTTSSITSMPPLQPVADTGKKYDDGENTTSSITSMPPLETVAHSKNSHDGGEAINDSINSMPPLEPISDRMKYLDDDELLNDSLPLHEPIAHDRKTNDNFTTHSMAYNHLEMEQHERIKDERHGPVTSNITEPHGAVGEQVYTDEIVWLYLKHMQNDRLIAIDETFHVTITDNDTGDDFICLDIKPTFPGVKLNEACEAFNYLLSAIQQKIYKHIIRLPRNFDPVRLVGASKMIKENYPHILAMANPANSGEYFFIGEQESAEEAARLFKEEAGILPLIPRSYNYVTGGEYTATANGPMTYQAVEQNGIDSNAGAAGYHNKRVDERHTNVSPNETHTNFPTQELFKYRGDRDPLPITASDDYLDGYDTTCKSELPMKPKLSKLQYAKSDGVGLRNDVQGVDDIDGDSNDLLELDIENEKHVGNGNNDKSLPNGMTDDKKKVYLMEIDNIQQAKKETPSIQLLYELLDNYDPSLAEYINEILTGCDTGIDDELSMGQLTSIKENETFSQKSNKLVPDSTTTAKSTKHPNTLDSIMTDKPLSNEVSADFKPFKIAAKHGTQPVGKMQRRIDKKSHLEGHDGDGMQQVIFTFSEGKPEFICFLPYDRIGRAIYKLLVQRFDEGKLFTEKHKPRVTLKTNIGDFPEEEYLERLQVTLEQM